METIGSAEAELVGLPPSALDPFVGAAVVLARVLPNVVNEAPETGALRGFCT